MLPMAGQRQVDKAGQDATEEELEKLA